MHFTSSFDLEIQFINTSGHQVVIKDLVTKFYTGDEVLNLSVFKQTIRLGAWLYIGT